MLLNEINKLAFIIAPVFWNLVYRSIVAVIAGFLWFAISKLLNKFINLGPTAKYFGLLLVFEVLILPTALIEQNDSSILTPLEPIQHISYRQEYDLYENHYFIAQQDESDHYMGVPDVVLKEKADRRYIKSMVCDVVLPLMWLVGTIASGIWLVYSDITLKKKIKLSGKPAPEWIYRIYEDNKAALNTKRKAEIIITDIVSVPAVFGLKKKKILLPSYTENMDRSTVANILIHEQQHIKRCDVEFSYFMMAVSVVYWFNPLIAKLMDYQRQEIELITDYIVLNKTNQDKEYTTALIDVLAQNTSDIKSNHLLCMTNSAKNMKQRIQNIKKRTFYKNNFIFIALLTASIFVAFNEFISPTFNTNPPTEAAMVTDSHGAMAVEKTTSIGAQSLFIRCTLPWNWSVETSKINPRPETDVPLPQSQFAYTMDIYQDDELIGYIGMSPFEPYTEEISAEDYHKTVWPGLRLSSMCIWEPFTSILQTENGESGLADINYIDYQYLAENPETPVAGAPQHQTFGILVYDKEEKMYAGFAFMPDKVSRETAEKIAMSVTMKNDGRKIEDTLSIVFKQQSFELEGKQFTCALPETWTVAADHNEINSAGIPVPLGHYGEVGIVANIYDGDELIGRIGVNSFTPYTGEIAPEKYWETVFPPLRLSSFFQWENFYILHDSPDKNPDGEYGLADIDYLDYTKLDDYPGRKPDVPSLKGQGVWAYDKEKEFFVCMAFIDGTVHDFTLSDIARHIRFE